MNATTTVEHFAREYAFDAWANRRLIAAMESAGGGSERARELMSHILGAQRLWLARLEKREMPADVFTPRPAAECAAIQTIMEAAWVAWLAKQPEDGFGRVLEYTNIKGDAFANSLRDILTHIVYHGMYHRGQLAAALKAEGVAVPGTDRITWARERGGEA